MMNIKSASIMRTKKFVGYAFVFLAAFTVSYALYYGVFDKRFDSNDISSEDNFRELINTENSLLLFTDLG